MEAEGRWGGGGVPDGFCPPKADITKGARQASLGYVRVLCIRCVDSDW